MSYQMGEGEGLIVCTESLPMNALIKCTPRRAALLLANFRSLMNAFYRNIESVANDLFIAMQLSFYFICYQYAERDLCSAKAVQDGLELTSHPAQNCLRRKALLLAVTTSCKGDFPRENMLSFFTSKMLFPGEKNVFLAVLINKNERS